MNNQLAIPCLLMRGGTSKGPFFYAPDLPKDIAKRDAVLLAAMGSPDERQIDGLGGAHSLTSKAGIVDLYDGPEADLSFLFAQLQPNKDTVDTKPNCGNMLAAVVPFALETGLITAQGDTTTVKVLTLNTGMVAEITVDTPNGQISYEGNTHIDGVPGTSAPIKINFLDTAGSVAGALLPTGNTCDKFDIPDFGKIRATCIDNGMPMVLVHATDVQRSGYESVDALNKDEELKSILEKLRLIASEKMGLGDVTDKNYPKMCLISPAQRGGTINTRCFIPHVCHTAIGVLAAVTVATACVLPDSVCDGITANVPTEKNKLMTIEHPSGEFTVELETDSNNPSNILSAALLRTARLLMRGEVMIQNCIVNS